MCLCRSENMRISYWLRNQTIWRYSQHRFKQFATSVHFSWYYQSACCVHYFLDSVMSLMTILYCIFFSNENFSNTKIMILFQVAQI